MKNHSDLSIGSIIQINPETHPDFGGDLVIVNETWSGGIQGYLAMVFPNNATRFKGVAYIRLKWEDFEIVGHVMWKLEHKSENEMGYQNDNQDDRSK